MTFKSALDLDCGLRYMYDNLELMSPCGRKMLLESEMMTSKRELDFYFRRLNEMYDKDCAPIALKLMCLKDIHNTLERLAQGVVLDDIELFEVKYLAMVNGEVLELLEQQNILSVALPLLDKVVAVLDPDHLNIPSFYVYDSYSDELRNVRKQMKAMGDNPDDFPEDKRAVYASLMQRNADIEFRIRKILSGKLKEVKDQLSMSLKNLSYLDILIAKVTQMKKMGLCFPVVVEGGETFYCKMFNPQVRDILSEKGKEFIPVDISFTEQPVTIIGANMGGKSVVLKTLALNQILAQFGFGIAAGNCCVSIVDEVDLCIGDEQDSTKGISSFAAEILAIDRIIAKLRSGKTLLALVDEPARTTNPVEGTALVEGLLEVIDCSRGGFVLTTHYNIENDKVKRYRVKGLSNGVMDYRLVEAHTGDVPHEAVAIAESLGVDAGWLECTRNKLTTNIKKYAE